MIIPDERSKTLDRAAAHSGYVIVPIGEDFEQMKLYLSGFMKNLHIPGLPLYDDFVRYEMRI